MLTFCFSLAFGQLFFCNDHLIILIEWHKLGISLQSPLASFYCLSFRSHLVIDQYRFFGFPTIVQKEYPDVGSGEGGRSEESTSSQNGASRIRTSLDGKRVRSESSSNSADYPSSASLHSSTGSTSSNLQDSSQGYSQNMDAPMPDAATTKSLIKAAIVQYVNRGYNMVSFKGATSKARLTDANKVQYITDQGAFSRTAWAMKVLSRPSGVVSGEELSTMVFSNGKSEVTVGAMKSQAIRDWQFYRRNNSNGTPTAHHKDELTMFNLVLIVPKEVAWDVALVGQRMAIQLASALRHEQDRCHYVSTEVFKMLRLRERWFTQHRKQSSTDSNPPPNHTALTYEILQASSLAQLIKNVYHSIRDEGSAQVLVNNWIQLSLNARSIYIPPNYHSKLASAQNKAQSQNTDSSPVKYENSTPSTHALPSPSMTPVSMALRLINDSISQLMVRDMRPLRPYHTLLILNQSKIFEALPLDASPSLRRVVECAVPTKSFREMQLDLGLPLEQLYRIAANFVYWKAAKVVDVLTRNNMYVLNPNPKDSDGNSAHLQFLSGTFENAFQSVKLFDLLSRFSTPKRLSEILQLSASQSKFVEMVTWLLRHDLIVQVHQFCYLQAPKLSSLPTPASPATITHSGSHPHVGTSNAPGSDKIEKADSSQKIPVSTYGVPSSASPPPPFEDERSSNPMNLVKVLQEMDDVRKAKEKEKRSSFASSPLHLMLAPIPLAPSERLSLSQHDNGSKEFKLFLRLCPYFRGAHHLTEIAWRENITKEELLKVIGIYKHLIVTTLCPEDAINGSPEM